MYFNNNTSRKRAVLPKGAASILNQRSLASSQQRLASCLTEGMYILDIGCGTGAITKGIADITGVQGKVIGIDSNPALIKQAMQNYKHIPGLHFQVGDIYQLPFTESFDIVTCSRVLQWLSHPLDAMKEMMKATKDGGKILVLDYNHKKIAWVPEPPTSMKTFYNRFLAWRFEANMNNEIADNLATLMANAGLVDIQITPQHEFTERGMHHFEQSLGIWKQVAASRGCQMVEDAYITETERITAIQDYTAWMQEIAISQTLYLLTAEGVK